ncbi:MAG: hypothetical protein ACI808_001840 [Paraglaciecola sp.]|jgi:hypothetical protein
MPYERHDLLRNIHRTVGMILFFRLISLDVVAEIERLGRETHSLARKVS